MKKRKSEITEYIKNLINPTAEENKQKTERRAKFNHPM